MFRQYIAAIRVPDYSVNTEKGYLSWISRFLRFHDALILESSGEREVASFLKYLATKRKVPGLPRHWLLNYMLR